MQEAQTKKIQGLTTAPSEGICCITNDKDEKLFFDAKTQSYFFASGGVGYCFWKNEDDAKKFITQIDLKNAIIKSLPTKKS